MNMGKDSPPLPPLSKQKEDHQRQCEFRSSDSSISYFDSSKRGTTTKTTTPTSTLDSAQPLVFKRDRRFENPYRKCSRRTTPQKQKQAFQKLVRITSPERRKLGLSTLKQDRNIFKETTTLRLYHRQSPALERYFALMKEYTTNHEHNKQYRPELTECNCEIRQNQFNANEKSCSLQGDASTHRGNDSSTAFSPTTHQTELAVITPNNELPNKDSYTSPFWSMEPRIFSSEKSTSGTRKYLVGQLGRFMNLYWCEVDALHRFYYELIPEKVPCRLYFDLEFSKDTNRDISVIACEALMDELFQELKVELNSTFGISNLKRSDVVDLESSTERKFSRHWIVHLPDRMLFEDTGNVGKFVKKLIARLTHDQATGNLRKRGHFHLQQHFMVNPPEATNVCSPQHKTTCFIDDAVYTRNRLFRMMGSQKFGKPPSAALHISNENRFPFPNGFSNSLFYLPEMHRKVATPKEDEPPTDWNSHAEALSRTFVVPVNWNIGSYTILPQTTSVIENRRSTKASYSKKHGEERLLSAAGMDGCSPYPAIDRFMVKVLGRRGGVQGLIRAWTVRKEKLQGEAGTTAASITYQMTHNRYCECIGRPHRRNNIRWTVDLQKWQCVQSCHDPDCNKMGYRGTPVRLPPEIAEEVRDQMFEEELIQSITY